MNAIFLFCASIDNTHSSSLPISGPGLRGLQIRTGHGRELALELALELVLVLSVEVEVAVPQVQVARIDGLSVS